MRPASLASPVVRDEPKFLAAALINHCARVSQQNATLNLYRGGKLVGQVVVSLDAEWLKTAATE